ncbi:MAG: GGDEF domain-containing protein, partial [Pseudomonadota bacterium]
MATYKEISVIRRVRIGYCLAIVAVAAMGMISFILQNRAIVAQGEVNALVDLVSEQQTLAQRLVLLTNLAHHEQAPIKRAVSFNTLREDLAAFETGHARLGTTLRSFDETQGTEIAQYFFDPPYDVNFFGRTLADQVQRFLRYHSAGHDAANVQPVSQMQSVATHAGLSVLRSAMIEHSEKKLAETSNLYRLVLSALLVLLAFEGAFIFAPLTRSIKSRTDQLKQARDRMSHLANHDQLTGLHNRTAMAFQFPKIIEHHASASSGFALVHLDLDDFKAVNDTYGHAAGDALLVDVG